MSLPSDLLNIVRNLATLSKTFFQDFDNTFSPFSLELHPELPSSVHSFIQKKHEFFNAYSNMVISLLLDFPTATSHSCSPMSSSTILTPTRPSLAQTPSSAQVEPPAASPQPTNTPPQPPSPSVIAQNPDQHSSLIFVESTPTRSSAVTSVGPASPTPTRVNASPPPASYPKTVIHSSPNHIGKKPFPFLRTPTDSSDSPQPSPCFVDVDPDPSVINADETLGEETFALFRKISRSTL